MILPALTEPAKIPWSVASNWETSIFRATRGKDNGRFSLNLEAIARENNSVGNFSFLFKHFGEVPFPE